MKLTINHLAPYLPYGLNLECNHIYEGFTCKLVVGNHTTSLKNGMSIDTAIDLNAKPMLMPLSKFEYDHVVQVKQHLGLGGWCDQYDDFFHIWFDDADNIYKLVRQAPYEIMEFFLESHLDVFNLIKQGLAVELKS